MRPETVGRSASMTAIIVTLEWVRMRIAFSLFPSRMGGFGLPPLETLRRGVPIPVAMSTCLKGVTADRLRLDDSAVAARSTSARTAEIAACAIHGATGRA